VATTENIPVLSTLLTIDGVTLAAGDLVLVKNQSAAEYNGVYEAATGYWGLSPTWTNALVHPQIEVTVSEGTINKQSVWVLSNTGTINIPFTALTFGPRNTGFPSRFNSNCLTVRVHATDPNADYKTIQAAIDGTYVSGNVATILVAPGTYAEYLTITGKRTLRIKGESYINKCELPTTYAPLIQITGASGTADSLIKIVSDVDHSPLPVVTFESIRLVFGHTGTADSDTALIECVDTSPASSPYDLFLLYLAGCVLSVQENDYSGLYTHTTRLVKVPNSSSRLQVLVEVSDVEASVSGGVYGKPFALNTAVYDSTIVFFGNSTIQNAASNGYYGLIDVHTVIQYGNTFVNRGAGPTSTPLITTTHARTIAGTWSGSAGNPLFSTGDTTESGNQNDIQLLVHTDGTNSMYKAALRLVSGDVVNPTNGNIWYSSTLNKYRAKENGVTVNLRDPLVGSSIKAGTILPVAFTGSSLKTATVTFTSDFPSTAYSITLSVDTDASRGFAPYVSSKSTTGFVVNLNSSNVAGLVEVTWQASLNGS
jgi:hypothetical protein